jgi:hypothetical protein
MRIFYLALTVLLVPSDQRPTPAFADYPVHTRYEGRAHSPDFSSLEHSRMFRTNIRTAAHDSINFAGEWTVIVWGCGTGCQYGAMVNHRTGRICWMPQAMGRGAEYRSTSRLLVLSPVTPEDDSFHDDPFVWYFEWTGAGFRLLDSLRASVVAGVSDPISDTLSYHLPALRPERSCMPRDSSALSMLRNE